MTENVASGDDHDYCEFHHSLTANDDIPLSEDGSVKEISVKSFSMAMGVRRPGFQLVSLGSPAGSPTLNDVPCLLPDQLGIYVSVYVPLVLLSLLALLLANGYRVWNHGAHTTWMGRRPRRTRSPTDEEQVRLWGSAPPPLPPTLHLDLVEASDEDEGGSYVLPPPTPAIAVSAKGRRNQSWLSGVSCDAVKVRSIRRLLLCCGGRGREASARRKRRGVLRGFVEDVVGVAWVPVVVFVAMAWWMLL